MPAIWLRHQGTKPRSKATTLAVVFVLLVLFVLDGVYVVHFPFGATMEFSDRESPQILLVWTVASHCCSHGQRESGHFSKGRTPILKSSLMFRLRSNVSSENSKYSSPSTVFSIPALIASKDEIFAALGVTNF